MNTVYRALTERGAALRDLQGTLRGYVSGLGGRRGCRGGVMVLIADGRSRWGMTGFVTPVAAPHFHGHHTIRLPDNTGGYAAYAVQHVATRRTQHNMLQRRQRVAAPLFHRRHAVSACAPNTRKVSRR